MDIDDEEIKKYLSKFTCRGCYNHCPLDNPMCGRSRIFINEKLEEYKNN